MLNVTGDKEATPLKGETHLLNVDRAGTLRPHLEQPRLDLKREIVIRIFCTGETQLYTSFLEPLA